MFHSIKNGSLNLKNTHEEMRSAYVTCKHRWQRQQDRQSNRYFLRHNEESEVLPPLWKSVLNKQLRLGILFNQFKKASFRSKYKCALFYILTKYYVVHKQNNRELILPSEVITNSVE